MIEMVRSSGADLELKTRFTDVDCRDDHIHQIAVEGSEGPATIQADIFIYATADIYLARASGCPSAIGPESSDVYNEPSAPKIPEQILNNASLCYRITPLQDDEPLEIQALPEDVDLDKIQSVTSIRTYPNGDLNMNPLHMMKGLEAYELGDKAYEVAQNRILAHWHILQTRYGFQFARWRLVWTSPMLGVRETHRLVG